MIKALKNEDYITAAKEMLDSRWARNDSSARANRLHRRFKKANNVSQLQKSEKRKQFSLK